MIRRLATYATGGAPESADKPEVERVLERARAKDYGLRTMVHEIVQSRLFREK
jgi:transposase